MVMTAKEAREIAEVFNLAKDDIIYKKLQEAIQQDASKGRFYTTINLPDCIVEIGDSGVAYYIVVKDRLDKAVLTLKNDGFKVTVQPSTYTGCKYEIVIDWSKEEDKA